MMEDIEIRPRVIDSLMKEEGFKSEVYKDHLGYDTIYYGAKMPITEEEHKMLGAVLLRSRLTEIVKELVYKEEWVLDLTPGAQDVVFELAYQLGVPRLQKFKKMFMALKRGARVEASGELQNSKLYHQTTERTRRLIHRLLIS